MSECKETRDQGPRTMDGDTTIEKAVLYVYGTAEKLELLAVAKIDREGVITDIEGDEAMITRAIACMSEKGAKEPATWSAGLYVYLPSKPLVTMILSSSGRIRLPEGRHPGIEFVVRKLKEWEPQMNANKRKCKHTRDDIIEAERVLRYICTLPLEEEDEFGNHLVPIEIAKRNDSSLLRVADWLQSLTISVNQCPSVVELSEIGGAS